MEPPRKSILDRARQISETLEAQSPRWRQKPFALAPRASGSVDGAKNAPTAAAAGVPAQRTADEPRSQDPSGDVAVRFASAHDAERGTAWLVGRRVSGAEAPVATAKDDQATHLTKAIDALRGRDRLGLSAEVMAAAGGAAAGVAASGTIAGALGVSTLLGSTTLASTLGAVFVTTTPVGWVIGSAALLGAAGYGIARLVRSGAAQDHIRLEVIERLTLRLRALHSEKAELLEELAQLVGVCMASGLIPEEQGQRLVHLVEQGALDASLALGRLRALAMESGVIKSSAHVRTGSEQEQPSPPARES